MKNSIQYIVLVICAFITVACGTSQLKEGEHLYTGAKIKIESDSLSKKEKNELKESLEDDVTPKPNSTFLGLRPKLFFYNLIGEPKKDKGIHAWLSRKLTEEPVLLRDVDRQFNNEIIVNGSENQGYFNATSSYETKEKDKTAKVTYTLSPGQRYTIRKIEYALDSTKIGKAIAKYRDRSILKKGKPFDLDVIKTERERIDARLKQNGFYYFHPDNLIIEADSTVSKYAEVDLRLMLKNDVPEQAKQKYRIGKVIIFADYNINDLDRSGYEIPYNTDSLEIYDQMYIIDPEDRFKPKMFDKSLQFEQGDVYNRRAHNVTLNRLSNLGVYKFVKNEFFIADSTHNLFDIYYLLTPKETQSLRLEANARNNSADFVGSEINLNWTHRNLFKRAEQLRFTTYGAFDMQVGGKRDANNIYRLGLEAELTFPRLLTPFKSNIAGAFVPRTNFTAGYEFLKKTNLYGLHNFNTSFGYLWKENIKKEHDLRLLDASLVYAQNVTDEYEEAMKDDKALRRVVEDQLIFGPTYAFTITNTMFPKKHTYYYKGMLDLSANITGLLMGADAEDGDQKKVFDIPFSQYVKMDHDFRYYRRFSKKHSLATRIIAGIAYPYGNSEYIPFSRQFFVGGANSIRAFQARTLGPGTFDPEENDDSFFFDQGGDIRLEMNLEYRRHLWKFLNFAAFVDAGNIWLVNSDDDRPGGKISKNFYKEIAIGAGLGLRFDFSILVLRVDLATPLRVPYYKENERWTFDDFDLGNKDWRKDNLMLNIAIGYPF